MMMNFFKRALAFIAIAGGALFAAATPAYAGAPAVVCGWEKDVSTSAGIKRIAIFYRNDLTAKSQSPVMNDDQWQRAQCDGYNGTKGAIDRIADSIKAQYGNMDGWMKQRYETTYADNCGNPDDVVEFFGNWKNVSGCPTFVWGKENYATASQPSPHDLLSCMYNGRTYSISYDSTGVLFQDVDNKKIYKMGYLQLNCATQPTYVDPPK
jgi:hypothetical protein